MLTKNETAAKRGRVASRRCTVVLVIDGIELVLTRTEGQQLRDAVTSAVNRARVTVLAPTTDRAVYTRRAALMNVSAFLFAQKIPDDDPLVAKFRREEARRAGLLPRRRRWSEDGAPQAARADRPITEDAGDPADAWEREAAACLAGRAP